MCFWIQHHSWINRPRSLQGCWQVGPLEAEELEGCSNKSLGFCGVPSPCHQVAPVEKQTALLGTPGFLSWTRPSEQNTGLCFLSYSRLTPGPHEPRTAQNHKPQNGDSLCDFFLKKNTLIMSSVSEHELCGWQSHEARLKDWTYM